MCSEVGITTRGHLCHTLRDIVIGRIQFRGDQRSQNPFFRQRGFHEDAVFAWIIGLVITRTVH